MYFHIRRDVYRQIDNNLTTEKDIIQDQIELSETIPDFSAIFGHLIEARILDSPASQAEFFRDTVFKDTKSGDYLPYRYIYFSGNTLSKRGYIIRISQSLNERQELLEAISLYLVSLFLSLLFISILLNYLISRKLWSPFYKSVNRAANYDILSDKPLNLPESDIIEFNQLNAVFERMTKKMRTDYLNLKEYNETAAHEVQTPLAIIRSKTELLMQNRKLNKDSLSLIKAINEATTRLFKLNKGLLLISKIENQYFHEKKEISLRQIAETFLDNYKEIMEIKGIRVEIEASDQAIVEMNEVLADVLITNLLSNAVRYNIDNGFIKCHIDNKFLVITNSGLPLQADPELFFGRFYKSSDNHQSVGLGLSIVKKITDNYKMWIKYSCTDNIHELKLNYRTNVIL